MSELAKELACAILGAVAGVLIVATVGWSLDAESALWGVILGCLGSSFGFVGGLWVGGKL